MRLIKNHGILTQYKWQAPTLVVLHHTAGGNISGAVSTLKTRGLGYHAMIDYDGTVYEYGTPKRIMWHAKGKNTGTVGIAVVGGGEYGPMREAQIHALVEYIRDHVKPVVPSLRAITGHKHVSPGRKRDPRFPGEPSEGVDLKIDKHYMDIIAKATGLTFLGKGQL